MRIESSFTIETVPLDGTLVPKGEIVHVINVRPEALTMRVVVQRHHVSLESEEEE